MSNNYKVYASQQYVDEKIANLDVDVDLSGYATEEYANNAANAVKNDLLNGAGEAYDTLKELGDLIDENVTAIDALETVATNKADKVHTHNFSEVEGDLITIDDIDAICGGTIVAASEVTF